ncbi:MAG: response regulator transcription factor [Bacteroidetes bacterium]|nr:response regulator transcription factor [Bacteroidota bacterium]
MFKTVIVDDEPKNLRILKQLLLDYCPRIQVIGEATDVKSAFEVIRTLSPDLVLLDIEMPYGNAFDLLDQLMPVDFEIIFVTAFDNYSLKAIKYSALDYLLKPVDIAELQAATDKAIVKIAGKNVNQQVALLLNNFKSQQTNLTKIAIPTMDGFVFLNVEDIIRCEANGAYTFIYSVKNEKVIASKSIKEYEELLPATNFCRIHNSHLVNLNRIKKYSKGRGGTIIMEDGAILEVASRRRDEFLAKFK